MSYELWIINYELWVMNYGLWFMNYDSWLMNYELWIIYLDPGSSGINPGSIRGHSGVNPGSIRGQSGVILGSFRLRVRVWFLNLRSGSWWESRFLFLFFLALGGGGVFQPLFPVTWQNTRYPQHATRWYRSPGWLKVRATRAPAIRWCSRVVV